MTSSSQWEEGRQSAANHSVLSLSSLPSFFPSSPHFSPQKRGGGGANIRSPSPCAKAPPTQYVSESESLRSSEAEDSGRRGLQ